MNAITALPDLRGPMKWTLIVAAFGDTPMETGFISIARGCMKAEEPMRLEWKLVTKAM